ncbi:hypothetical protein HK101_006111, partial [Irineochytrium annulatum]
MVLDTATRRSLRSQNLTEANAKKPSAVIRPAKQPQLDYVAGRIDSSRVVNRAAAAEEESEARTTTTRTARGEMEVKRSTAPGAAERGRWLIGVLIILAI